MINRLAVLVGLVLMVLPELSPAQQVLSDAVITYKVTVSPQQGGRAESNLENVRYVVTVKGGFSRTEMTSPLGTETTVFDPRSGSGYIIKEYGGTKLLINTDRGQWMQQNKTYSGLDFVKEKGNLTIGSHDCLKATSLLPSGKKITVYYDPALVLANVDYHLAFTRLKGLPVRFELEQGGMTYQYDLVSLSLDPVSYSRFEVPVKGYRVISYDEFRLINKE